MINHHTSELVFLKSNTVHFFILILGNFEDGLKYFVKTIEIDRFYNANKETEIINQLINNILLIHNILLLLLI